MAAMPRTASELLVLYELLPEPEQALMLEKLSNPPQFQEEKFTSTYKGVVIEVYRCEESEKLFGGKCWASVYTNVDGEQIHEAEFHRSPEKCLEITREMIAWEIEQKDIGTEFTNLLQKFEAKGYTHAGILFSLRETLGAFNWNRESLMILEQAVKMLQLPERTLP